ncbi:pectate lyase, PelA/Pel-15E family [Gracilibacillus orientalis]|uniref:Pectate lyase, PelA/Pel-15E family n=1 Tax=Gracilibacillus orientalis TaxID=334253 RepID=A0A1I4HPZ0_9BACI|nr:pectate lyase [Gracilibacillus orientalis]SFL43446.1 pectate lyase, PelA/Pel-15E family [Gracilibacillus orientalis]
MKGKRTVNVVLIFMLVFTTVFSTMPVTMVKAESDFNNVVIFEEDFNEDVTGEAPANLDVSEDGGEVTVEELPDADNKSVFLNDTSDSDDVLISKSMEDLENQVTIEMKFMQPEYTSSTKVMRLKGDGTSVIIETNDGFIGYRNSDDSYENLVEVQEGEWYDIKVEVDLTNNTVDAYVNEELKVEGEAFYEDASKINFMESFTPGSKALGHYIDDLRISQLEEVELPPEEPEADFAFGTDFNDDAVGEAPSDVTVSESGGTATIADVPSEENKSVFLDDESDDTNVLLSKSVDDLYGVVTLEMNFMQPSYTSSTKVMRIKGDSTPVIIETNDGYISYRTGGEFEPLVEVEEGTWHKVKVEIDLDAQHANVYINDELELEEAELNQPAEKVNFVESFTPNSGQDGHYVDDLNITGFYPQEDVEEEEEATEESFSFEANFNDDGTGDAPANVDVLEGGGTVTVADQPSDANKSAFLDDTSDETNVILSKSVEDLSGVVTVETLFMQPSYTSSTKVMRVKGDGTPVIIETKDGSITYRTGDNYHPLVEVEEGTWYKVTVEIDLDAQHANVYIDDELVHEEAALNESATNVNFVESFTPNSGTDGHYIDDLKISGNLYQEPEEEEPNEPEEPEKPEEPAGGDIYEAEDAEISDAIIDNKHAGFTGTGFVDYAPNAPGGWIEWVVNVPVDGEYTLDFRYAHGGTDRRPAQIEVNGEVEEEELSFDPTGDWAGWEYTATKAQLSAGENVIRATGVGSSGGANIDHLQVLMEYDEIYEAEDAELEEDTVIIDNKHTGFTGDGFIDFSPNAPGSWVEWTVDVPVGGEYFLDFRYGHGGTDQRPAEIQVNNEIVEDELAFDSTGDWANWEYTSTKTVLEAGENTILATGVGSSGGANIDHLRVHNKSEAGNEGPIDVEATDIEEVVSGVELKKLNELGIVVNELPANDEAITRIEFFALVNQALGYVQEEQFKGLTDKETVWETSTEEWYSYVLEAAQELGYADHLVSDHHLNPNETITGEEAVQIIESASDQTAESSSEQLTWNEARELIALLEAENESETVEVAGVHAVSNNLLAVTLNGNFEEFTPTDLEVVVPTRRLELLSPGFTSLNIDKAAKGTNKFGQTVIVMHSLDEWNEYAEYPVESEETRFSGDLDNAIEEADNLLTWQMDHGGWTKNWPHIYTRPWDGEESRSEWVEDGVELGTIDNDATISELQFLAEVYQETKDPAYKESIEKGLDFLFDLQYESGGFAQVYPERGNYSDYVTFNDEAMVNVLELLDLVAEQRYPFNSDLLSEEYVAKSQESIDLGVDYILNAQIEVDGKLTAWCAQHDPYTYEAREARSYEHPSISGSESVGIVRYLMTRPQTEEINQAVLAALEWFDEAKLENTRYVSGDPNNEYFVEDSNSTAWYRFYEIGTNKPIFSGRDGVIKHDIMEIEAERRDGYSWGGHWATQLLEIMQTTGDYTDKVFVRVTGNDSVDVNGKTLAQGDIKALEGQTKQMDEIESHLVVAQDGSGDYDTVQAAIDAVPDNNRNPVTIFVKDGTYKEVVTIPNNKPFVTLLGESKTDTIITYDNYAGRDNGVGGTMGTSGSASVYLRADDLRIENLTLENSFDESADVEGQQAVAVYASGDRQYFNDVRFIGNQDTLYTHSGTQYYGDVYIEGDVDFIFGGARVVIDDAVIHSLDRGSDSNNGYVTAASTLLSEEYGMLFLDSKFTSDAPAETVYLGRPWPAGGNSEAIGSVVIKESKLGEHIKPEGWTSMSGLQPEDARLYEYKNEGPGAVINESRRQLTDEEAADWTVQNVLKGWDPYALDPVEEPDEDPDEDSGEEEPEEDPGEEPEGENPGNDNDEDSPEEGSDGEQDSDKPETETPEGENEDDNESGNETQEIEVELGEETEVAADWVITIADSQTKVTLPSDLPEGTSLVVEEAQPQNLGELKVEGDVYTFEFTFPEGFEDYTGDFQLTMGHEEDAENIAIYYYNEANNSWELIDSEVSEGVVTATVNHFSTYGVLAAEEEREQVATDNDESTNGVGLPDTATNIFNWLLASGLLLMLGVGLLWFSRKRKQKMVQ